MNLAIGDEQTIGYNPKSLNHRNKSKFLSNALDEKTISRGLKGASLTIKNKNNVIHQLDQFSIPAYDRIILFYGANDYFYSKAELMTVGKQLSKAIAKIRNKNKWIRIYGILPLPMYDKNGNNYTSQRGPAMYTLRNLMDMLSITYANNNVASLNWMTLTNPIINHNNYQHRLINGRYPTKDTYHLMSERINEFINDVHY